MFDLFSVSPSQVDEVAKGLTIQTVALMRLLVVKGVCTEDEITTSIQIATGMVDQEWQRRKDAAREELQREHPGLALLEKMLRGAADNC